MSDLTGLFSLIGKGWTLLKSVLKWRKEAPSRETAERFLKVFNDHGIKNTQIQRLLPEVTLDKVTDPMALLSALTNDVLTKTAKTLGIERAWLDGVQERMYRHRGSYQHAAAFFDVVRGLERPFVWHPLRAYCLDPNLDLRKGSTQTIVLVFAEKICDWDDDGELLRFIPFTGEWDWGYGKSRLQLKATIRACHEILRIREVPLYQVDRKTLNDLSGGRIVPPDVDRSHDVSLEDFVLTSKESAVAKETEELETVISWMKHMKMEELAREAAGDQKRHTEECEE
jgi:hypothetical protein